MSEDSGEKAKRATPKKISDARERGEVSQSQDLSSLLVLAVVTELALVMAEGSMQQLGEMVLFPVQRLNQPFVRAFEEVLTHAGWVLLRISLMTVGTAITVRCLSSWMQFGFVFATDHLKPDLSRLDPMSQLKQMFAGQALMGMLMGLVKATFIGSVLYLLTQPVLGELISLVNGDLEGYWRGLAACFRHIMHVCLAVLLVLALTDFGMQKYFYAKRLRMSEEEVRKESKELEGDRDIKDHRKRLAQELIDKPATPAKRVEDADMLVINPTHFAVALFYRPEATPLPLLVAKGTDAEARQLIERGKAAGVPVIQCLWLARTLYREAVGGYIPRETLQAVAHIYRVLRELDREALSQTIEMPDLHQR